VNIQTRVQVTGNAACRLKNGVQKT